MTSTGRVATTTLNHRLQTGALGDDPAVPQAERPQLAPEQDHHRHDGAQLDHHPEHGKKGVAGIEPDQLLHQDHVAGGRNGQPFGDALDDAHQQGFDDFYEHGFPSLRRLCRARMTLVLSVYHIMSRAHG